MKEWGLDSAFKISSPENIEKWPPSKKRKKVWLTQSPVSIRELARQLGRDVRWVHDDVSALTEEGVIEKNETLILIFR